MIVGVVNLRATQRVPRLPALPRNRSLTVAALIGAPTVREGLHGALA
jgi:hypothetical protein